MLNAITRKNFQPPVIHPHRNVKGNLFVRILQIPVKTLRQAKLLRGNFKTRVSRLVNIQFVLRGSGNHGELS